MAGFMCAVASYTDSKPELLKWYGKVLDAEAASSQIGFDTGVYYDGKLGSIKVYDKTLDANQISWIYNNEKSRFGL